MNYSELIQGYLDNSLTQGEEATLFIALSANEELRNELKQSIAMDKSMSKRVTAFVPSSASTVNIFSQLGIGAAAGAATTAAALGFKQVLFSFFSTYSQAIITGVITAVLTTAGFVAFHNPPDKNHVFSGENGINGNYSYNNLNNLRENGYANIYSVENDNSTLTDTVIKFITRNIVIKQDSDTQPFDSLPEADLVNDNQPVQMITASATSVNASLAAQHEFNNRFIDNRYNPLTPEITNDKNYGFSVELKGNGYWAMNKPDVPQYSSSLLTNMQLTALYKLSDNLKLGFDIRQESFYQKFSGINEIGEEFIYKQYPGYISIGLVGRYSFLKNNFLTPFVQLGLGGTATGYTGRALVGLELFPLSDLAFIIGIEGSNLLYLHQGKIFNSPKLGLNYGISFNF